jgi:hypothetical protein
MSEHDAMVLKMMFGAMVSGLSVVFFAYGAGLIYRSWGWWHL